MRAYLIRRLGYYYGRCVSIHISSIWYLFIEGVNLGRLKRQAGKLGEHPKVSVSAQFDNIKYARIGNKVEIGGHCFFELPLRAVVTTEGAKLSQPSLIIGDNCSFGEYTHVTCVNEIKIGDNLLTGRNCLITDHSHGKNDGKEKDIAPSERLLYSKGPVIIGNNVWLGDKVAIMSGVTIGEGTVVAANAVVTHDLPPYVLAGGVPARVIKNIKE